MTEPRTMRSWLLIAVLVVAAIGLPFVVPTYYVQFATKALIMGLLAMALNLAVGHGGLVSLCHAAFFGVAGYALAMLTPKYDPASLWLTLPVAVGAAAFVALVIGALALRTRGVYFIMVTLAFGEMLFYLFHDTKIAGGSDGAYVNYKPEVAIGGYQLINLEKPIVFYLVVLACLIGTVALIDMLVRSPFGRALAAARDNERRARSLGFPIFRIRLTAFVISGALAGVAGYFAAAQFGFVAPQMLGWHQSATVLVMVLLGGLRSVAGPLVGAIVLMGLEEVLKATTVYWKLVEGLIVVIIVLALPNGVRQLLTLTFGEPAQDKPAAHAVPATTKRPVTEAGHG